MSDRHTSSAPADAVARREVLASPRAHRRGVTRRLAAGERPGNDVLVIADRYGARLQVELALVTSRTLNLVGASANGFAGAELAEQLQPDVVVLDLTTPEMDGSEAVLLIRALVPTAKIVVRSDGMFEEGDERVLQLGAAGIVPISLGLDDLRRTLEHIADPRPRAYVPRADPPPELRPAAGRSL